MKTQQAVSLGRDAALRRRDPRQAQRARPVVWLNLVCLDAPLVAVAWLALFAQSFRIPFQLGNCIALFLTAWLIYLADRFADCTALQPDSPRSLRQEFCVRHREIWIALIVLVAGFDAYVIWRTTPLETFLVGAVVGGLALIYLVVNHPLGLIWRSLPAKELAIGILFTAGTLVALMPHAMIRNGGFEISAAIFAGLCALNCISIAGWERELDTAQGKVSIATRHPGVTRTAGVLCAILAAASFVLAINYRAAAPLLACTGISASLLCWLNRSSPSLGTDERTALADLVLLTPVAAVILASL